MRERARRNDGADQLGLTIVTVSALVFGYAFMVLHLFSTVAVPACATTSFGTWHTVVDGTWPLFGSLSLAILLLFFWNGSMTLDAVYSRERRKLALLLGSFNGVAVLVFAWILWHQVTFLEREAFWEEAETLGWNTSRGARGWFGSFEDECQEEATYMGTWAIVDLHRPLGSGFPAVRTIEFLPNLEFIAHSGPFGPRYRGTYRSRGWFGGLIVRFSKPFAGSRSYWGSHWIFDTVITDNEIAMTTPEWDAISNIKLRLRRVDEGHSREAQIQALRLGTVDW